MNPLPLRLIGCRFRLALCSASLAWISAGPLTVLAQPAPGSKVEVPIISQDAAIQRDLLSLDQQLEINPKLEETLRNNLDQILQEKFRAQNPDVDALLKRQPTLVQALKTERHFFIHRYIARLARAKVTRKDAVALDEFLSGHPDIAKALAKRPGQIVESNFLIAHPQLAHFFEAHPALSSVILQRNDKKPGGKADAKK